MFQTINLILFVLKFGEKAIQSTAFSRRLWILFLFVWNVSKTTVACRINYIKYRIIYRVNVRVNKFKIASWALRPFRAFLKVWGKRPHFLSHSFSWQYKRPAEQRSQKPQFSGSGGSFSAGFSWTIGSLNFRRKLSQFCRVRPKHGPTWPRAVSNKSQKMRRVVKCRPRTASKI